MAIELLIVEPAEELRETYQQTLERLGFDVRTAPGGEVALAMLRCWRADVAIVEPERDRCDLVAALRDRRHGAVPPVIVLSRLAADLLDLDPPAAAYFRKPVSLARLAATIRGVLEHQVALA